MNNIITDMRKLRMMDSPKDATELERGYRMGFNTAIKECLALAKPLLISGDFEELGYLATSPKHSWCKDDKIKDSCPRCQKIHEKFAPFSEKP